MPDNLSPDNPKTIWQNQPVEPSTMTLKLIRQKARDLHGKTRRELYSHIALALFSVAICTAGLIRTHDPGIRLVCAIAIGWAFTGQYLLHRGMWSAMMPGDAALSTGFEFYRQEVRRRTDLFRRVLQWSLGPLLLSICALILVLSGLARSEGRSLRAMLPFCTLTAIWIVGCFIQRSRGHKELQREIADLKEIEREITA